MASSSPHLSTSSLSCLDFSLNSLSLFNVGSLLEGFLELHGGGGPGWMASRLWRREPRQMAWLPGAISWAELECFSAGLVNKNSLCYWVPDLAESRVGGDLQLVLWGDLSSALVFGEGFRDQDHLLSVFVFHRSKARTPSRAKRRRWVPKVSSSVCHLYRGS